MQIKNIIDSKLSETHNDNLTTLNTSIDYSRLTTDDHWPYMDHYPEEEMAKIPIIYKILVFIISAMAGILLKPQDQLFFSNILVNSHTMERASGNYTFVR